LALKKAWLLVSVACGHRLTDADGTIPDYASWTRKDLQEHVAALEEDYEDAVSRLSSSRTALALTSITWMAQQFDRWIESGQSQFTVATAQQFEARVGRLAARQFLDVPPYAEVLLQPGHAVALRHPEYMLARDLSMLVDLYLDAEAICAPLVAWNAPEWAGAAGENVQALARATIQACFNLLESFVSGLARAHVMTGSALGEDVVERLLSTREPLRKRVRAIPSLITGRECPLSLESEPLVTLFGDVKRRRDSFVHCEPGPMESEHGYVKEAAFNNIDRELVPRSVRATHDTVRALWRFVHGREGPRWLPPLEPSGRFGLPNLKLVAPPSKGAS
jgi:hypothetical protein